MQFIKLYFQNLTIYDKVGFGFVGIVFLLLFIIGIIVIFKKPIFGILLVILSFFIIPGGVYGVKYIVDNSIRKCKLSILDIKQLHFTKAVFVEGNVSNVGKITFSKCYITFKFIKRSDNKYKNFFYSLKPLKNMTILIYHRIEKGSIYKFRKILDNTIYDKNYEKVATSINCY